MISRIPGQSLGAIVTFRYLAPTANDPRPLVMVLTEQHMDGYLHGLNMRYLTPLHQQQLQHFFRPPGQQQPDHINPFQQQEMERMRQQQEAERKQQELLQTSGYVVRPEPNSTFGVSTFTRTKDAIVQKARGAMGYLRRFIPFGGQQQPPQQPQPSPFANMNQQTAPLIDNPTAFYYQYVKPILGPNTKNAYRKYKHEYINGFQIIRTVNSDYGGR